MMIRKFTHLITERLKLIVERLDSRLDAFLAGPPDPVCAMCSEATGAWLNEELFCPPCARHARILNERVAAKRAAKRAAAQ